MEPYDIEEAFAAIEEELIASMMRNMKRHKVEESAEEMRWEMWQAKQLQALEKYKKQNQKKFQGKFADINGSVDEIIHKARKQGGLDQEIEIMNAIKKGWKPPGSLNKSMQTTGEFFKLNDRKLNALIGATRKDFSKAEHAMLRMADDQYRKIIFNAQVYANTGAGTYEKAVDMATKDFLGSGINCIEYKNGARHKISDYAFMAIQTASKRAYLTGEGEKRQEWGISTVIVNKRGNPCPKCLPFVGKILVDDVWSGGKPSDGKYPLMSTAIAAGLYHPRCKDSHTTYFEGISSPPDDKFTKKEMTSIEIQAKQESRWQYAERQSEKFQRLASYSLDEDNKKQYKGKANIWKYVKFRTGDKDSHQYVGLKRPLANFRALPQNQVVNVLRKESDEWIDGLTDIEKKALRKYTYNSGDKKPNRFFEKINAMLRGDIPESKMLSGYANSISGALKKSRLQHDVICYRKVSVNPIEKRDAGSIIKLKQFISTSVIPGRALSGVCEITIYVPKGTNAAYIEKLSAFPNQRELLLDKDCIYRVISNKGNEIELEVIP